MGMDDLRKKVVVYPRVCGGTLAGCLSGVAETREVYPRVCGGTNFIRDFLKCLSLWGLSPRVRGNPHPQRHVRPPLNQRSIPACAGEPDFGHLARSLSKT